MMEKTTKNEHKFSPITDKQIKAMGVQALANRPNAVGQYGQSGLSPAQLKLWFDKLVTLAAEKINELQTAINGEEAAKYIGLALKNYPTLDELIAAMQDGRFAREVLRVFPSAAAFEAQTLESVIFGIAETISDIEEDKLDKQEPGVLSAYTVDAAGENGTVEISALPKAGTIPVYDADKEIPVEDPQKPTSAMNLRYFANYMNEMAKHIGAGVKFIMDPETFIVTVEVVNIAGDVIYRTFLDLPLEEMILHVDYDGEKKALIITLKSGEKKEIAIPDIVSGLVTDAQHSADIKALDEKMNRLFGEYVEEIDELVGGDYVDYSE